MGDYMLASTDLSKKKRGELNIKRTSLFKKYLQNPNDLQLALEIKRIDDEIAECTDKMRDEKLSERKSKPLPLAPSKN
jgi:hypothetical protein